MSDRHEMQAAGTHPAPCARHCEANAFEIEIRRLRAEVERLRGITALCDAVEAARAAALEEAAEVCERIGPAMAESYGPGAECITTSDECADAIRALKEKE